MSHPSPPSSWNPSPTPPSPVLAPGTPPTFPRRLSLPSPFPPAPSPGTPGLLPPPSPPPAPHPAPTTNTATTAATFPLFARLPPKLRSYIWQLALMAEARRQVHTLGVVAPPGSETREEAWQEAVLAVLTQWPPRTGPPGVAEATFEARHETARLCARRCARLPTYRLTHDGGTDWPPARIEAVAPRLYHVDSRHPAASARCGGDVVWWLPKWTFYLSMAVEGQVEGEDEESSGELPRTPSPRITNLAHVMIGSITFLIAMKILPTQDSTVRNLTFARWSNLRRLVVGIFCHDDWFHDTNMILQDCDKGMIEGPYDELVEEVEEVPPSARATMASYDDDGG